MGGGFDWHRRDDRAGIFSILGVVGQISGNALWISFVVSGIVALLMAYNLAKLGARYPSAGGPAEYLVQGFGDGVLSGGLNILLWIVEIFALALYSRAFGEYGRTFFPANSPGVLVNILAIAVFSSLLLLTSAEQGQSENLKSSSLE